MLGVVLVLLAMFLIGPIAVFLGGAIWSALFGWAVGGSVMPADDAGANATTA
jgi:hypothetical protein